MDASRSTRGGNRTTSGRRTTCHIDHSRLAAYFKTNNTGAEVSVRGSREEGREEDEIWEDAVKASHLFILELKR